MACILIDHHQCAPNELKPEIPLNPACTLYLPPGLEKKAASAAIVINIITPCVLFGIVLPCAASSFLPAGGANEDPVALLFFIVGTFIVFAIVCGLNVMAKNYFNKQIENDNYKIENAASIATLIFHSGLKPEDPHYRKHLEYYKAHGSWILPNEE